MVDIPSNLIESVPHKGNESRELRLRTLRNWYLGMIAAADTKIEKFGRVSHLNNPAVKAAWEMERSRLLGVATGRIVEMVGKEDTDLLREVVAPENLKDVLLRAGAGFDALMMIGEGKEELGNAVAQRRKLLSNAQEAMLMFSGKRRLSLEYLETKLKKLDAEMAKFEEKDRWDPFEVQRYRSLKQDFSTAFQGFNTSVG